MMSNSTKWCEWCYAALVMEAASCKFCESNAFRHQDPQRERIDPWEAREKRKNKEYASAPKVSYTPQEPKPQLDIHAGRDISDKKITSLSDDEHRLNREIAELVVRIEELNLQLQNLLEMKSPEIRKNREMRSGQNSASFRSPKASSSATSGLIEAVGELFDL